MIYYKVHKIKALQTCPSPNSQNLSFLYNAKGMFQIRLSPDGDYPGGPNVITRVLMRGRRDSQRQWRWYASRCFEDGGRHLSLQKSREQREGMQVTSCRWPLDAGTCKEANPPEDYPEATQSCQHLDFRLSETHFRFLTSRTLNKFVLF